MPSLLLQAFQALERRHEQKGDRTGVTSGYRDIDDYTAGWQPGNLVILAARPAMGKTSMALNMAVHAAKDEKKPVAVFSLEMTKQELVERLLSSEARLDASKLRRGAIATATGRRSATPWACCTSCRSISTTAARRRSPKFARACGA